MTAVDKLQGMPLVLKALHFAADKHRHQRRKDAGASPYINHPIALAEVLCTIGGVEEAVTIAAAVLHDTIEDTETTAAELEEHFGTEIRRIVEEVTDDKTLDSAHRKQLQVERAATSSAPAQLVKLADKICNVRDIIDAPPTNWSLRRRRGYIDWARAVVERLRGRNAALERYFDQLCERGLTGLPDEP
jgi:GTP diphosphokinase / guanosine-3',5'-bis(diphosphate) 3'-diphosphatase